MEITEIKHPEKSYSGKYRFITEVKTESIKNTMPNVFIRKVEIHYLGKIKDFFRYQILCIDINFEGPTLDSVPLLKRISSVFDEVILSINFFGEIISIHNLNSLRIRWETVKIKLSKDNIGHEMLNYFSVIDTLLSSHDATVNFLKEQNMYGIYFNGYWGLHNSYFSIKEKKFKKEIFSEEYKIKSFNSTNNKIEIEGKSESKIYNGFYEYNDGVLKEAVIESKENTNHIKYKILCLGLKKA